MTIEAFVAQRDRGHSFRDRNLPAQAAEAYRAALVIKPDDAETQFYLGLMLRDLHQLPAAATAFDLAARLEPRAAEAFSNLGLTLLELNRPDDALQACRRALALRPQFAEAWCNLGLALETLGQLEGAVDCFRNAVQLSPQNAAWHSNLLYALNCRPADAQTVFDEHRAWAARHADPLSAAIAGHENTPEAARRLRVGYVSAHFRHHAVNFFVEPILAAHDHERFEIFAYSDVALPQHDDATRRIMASVDTWRDISGRSDEEVVAIVRADRIDLLVDLAGHIGGNRLLVFARRPAPVQVTYLGYQNTTGMRAMDYRLTDAWSDPPGLVDQLYTETLVRLPETFFCYRPHPTAPAVRELPARTNGSIAFGSFNNFAKVGPAPLDAWARILATVERSRLILLVTAPAWLREQVQSVFARRGVAADRVQFADQRPTEEFLSLMGQVDIALDSFPMNGHTTTCDALWMGVPVVMLAGDRYATRFGGTALRQVGLDDLIAGGVDQYVARAVGLAGDLAHLADLRRTLRARVAHSPIMDGNRFVRNLEAAYRTMWAAYCDRSSK